MIRAGAVFAAWVVALAFISPVCAADAPAATSVGETRGDMVELSKKLANPVSELWSLSLQQNNYRVSTLPGQDDEWNSNLNFQPVLPVALTSRWNLITRPVITVFNSVPYPALGPGGVEIERTTAVGDTVWMEMFSPSPSVSGKWLLGIGPTFIFPTAASDYTGQGKWQVGPAAIVGYLDKKWILGGFVQNWTSFAGDGDRADTNQMNLQPIASWFFPGGWSVGYSGNILANWEESGDEVWTVPLGIAVSRMVRFGRLPVKLQVAGQYMPIHPDDFGQEWNVQLSVSPVLPKLIKGTLFE
jgi:hypothetical protein